MISQDGLNNFSEQVLKYFLEFIETDFKRQQAPRRKIALRNDAGFRTGFLLRKYPTLFKTIWEMLSKPIDGDISSRVPRNKFKAPLSENIKDLISKHVNEISDGQFGRIREITEKYARDNQAKGAIEPESYVDMVCEMFAESMGEQIIAPLLATLDEVFNKKAYSAIESAYELEADLIQAIASPALEHLPKALNTLIVTGKIDEVNQTLQVFFDEADVKSRILEVFEGLATSDAYSELRDLMHFINSGSDLQFYLYACDVKFEAHSYPLFYFPGNISYVPGTDDFLITLDPHYYVNRRAIDYILGKQDDAALLLASAPIDKRIVYIGAGGIPTNYMQPGIRGLTSVFRLPHEMDLTNSTRQSPSTTTIRISNSLYFAVFDKADEALLNDYEALIMALQENQQEASSLFNDILKSVLFDNPVTIHKEVDQSWDETGIPERLVMETPIPLNEEQRKILLAAWDDKCRFITVEGPPGTGKSHTITAIAFDCIMKSRNVLILSDKAEALDVVEDKLTSALMSVRMVDQGGDFPNPILRLGKSGTFNQLVKKSALDKIRNFTKANDARRAERESEKTALLNNLKGNIAKTSDLMTSVQHKHVEEFLACENIIDDLNPHLKGFLLNPVHPFQRERIDGLVESHAGKKGLHALMDRVVKSGNLKDLAGHLYIFIVPEEVSMDSGMKGAMKLFPSLSHTQFSTLGNYVTQYEKMKMPVFGFLFSRRKARELNMRIKTELLCANADDLHHRTAELRRVLEACRLILVKLKEYNLSESYLEWVYKLICSNSEDNFNGATTAHYLVKSSLHSFGEEAFDFVTIGSSKFPTAMDAFGVILNCNKYLKNAVFLKESMENVPQFDYVAEKKKIERLCTLDMADKIDTCFLNFVDSHKADVTTLAAMVKAKQQFPTEKFDGLKKAFPCIIAGIREFAEYVPLSKDMFDLVVIDEASQVSVAQAFPAILRAKKVVVFGDMNQYSNVKSQQASITRNDAHRRRIEQAFRAKVSDDAATLQRLQQFDVKKSILEFFDMIGNYAVMLKKHFRGYQELISYSSENFYNHGLQAIKLRGKPLDEIIEFTEVKEKRVAGQRRNTNMAEVNAILAELRRLIDEEDYMTVGVITPFREQQQILSKTIFADEYSDRFECYLRLKVMTFDSCQGEERDIIMYSMVATEDADLLNYIFPVDLKKALEEESGALKRQRLNVGLSRSKEKMHFFISKPVDKFHGSIGQALRHYNTILNSTPMPGPEETDPSSPMEAKALEWIKATPFCQKHREDIELIAQYPIGDYLKQLDPLYQHPSYRCDFLLRYYGEETVNIIIEYDGFLEHFKEHGKVHHGNYDRFYKPEDIERQMVIESYGYKFLRLNRFNLGTDPVETISGRLTTLLKDAERKDFSTESAKKVQDDANGLANGQSKQCPKCKRILPKEKFLDASLKSGIGKNCVECKTPAAQTSHRKSKSRGGGYYRRWY